MSKKHPKNPTTTGTSYFPDQKKGQLISIKYRPNNPCFCGFGKKQKRCCGDKNRFMSSNPKPNEQIIQKIKIAAEAPVLPAETPVPVPVIPDNNDPAAMHGNKPKRAKVSTKSPPQDPLPPRPVEHAVPRRKRKGLLPVQPAE